MHGNVFLYYSSVVYDKQDTELTVMNQNYNQKGQVIHLIKEFILFLPVPFVVVWLVNGDDNVVIGGGAVGSIKKRSLSFEAGKAHCQ